MNSSLLRFEFVVRKSSYYSNTNTKSVVGLHPFEERNIHPKIPAIVQELFDDGHYAQATFEAYKFIDKVVQRLSNLHETGTKLMMQAFGSDNPAIRINPLQSVSERDEQKGYSFIFSGAVLAIRNPRGHEFNVIDSPDKCLDHLCLASLLCRRLEEAGLSLF